ncbi:unnamed protein product [Arctia plantaginis]|uniref:Uncharacterized protein n=1 Tax=Arctia plantaginis TaxID=874455 RepID=A0A8S0ZM33_ARCPL|nr:unnamed protein product [Arctia plantaginis]
MVIKKCFGCKKNITKKSPGLECSRCSKVVHANSECAKLSNKQLSTLRNSNSIEWSCETCLLNTSRRTSYIIPEDDDADEDSDSGTVITHQSTLDHRKLIQDISRELKRR